MEDDPEKKIGTDPETSTREPDQELPNGTKRPHQERLLDCS
jgi:hypothetical protein